MTTFPPKKLFKTPMIMLEPTILAFLVSDVLKPFRLTRIALSRVITTSVKIASFILQLANRSKFQL